jgi:hypothetical protein
MKTTKSVLVVLGLFLAMFTFMRFSCNKSDDQPNQGCNGYITATASGFLSSTFCFVDNPQYTFRNGGNLNFSATVTVNGVN